ncbi:NERD domain-containing protein [Bacillus tianshenii]|uniref:nuclease-related domain-containing protein n=1 Tax=Sutcliffiella tianshenii TaxID=1463404 RepID=UPI001CD70193|nr:nuclease-related domain-containing protein [Bacillus tianshenii]MCA1321596.1 NERD domain-containing protein [Bacillus tianshenii]
MLLNFFRRKKNEGEKIEDAIPPATSNRSKEEIAERKGELGEYKIDIQLDQLPKGCRYLSDLLIKNPMAKSGYSQIDHVVLTPYGIFVIETKNYQGTIYGGKDRKTWLVNGKFKIMNPFVQNYGHIKALTQLIQAKYHDSIISMVSFTKRCTFKVDIDYRKIASNELIVYDIELSDFIHRKLNVLKIQHKNPLLSQEDSSRILHTLSTANITDVKVREHHKASFKSNTQVQASKNITTCTVCNKPVSEKVKNYCISTNKFNGKIYCYEHQKTL